jgi:hypothetical protein
MKMRGVIFAAFVLVFVAPVLSQIGAKFTIDFEKLASGSTPAAFTPHLTGRGSPGSWEIREDSSAPAGSKVLAQTSTDTTDYRFPVLVYDSFIARDPEVSVACKAVAGRVDQACGLVARFSDKDHYYVARANALENNVRLYHVVAGRRVQFAGVNHTVTSGQWHTLTLDVKGANFRVSFDGKLLFEAYDTTLANAGKVGLWTKADSVTYFDNFSAVSHDAVMPGKSAP